MIENDITNIDKKVIANIDWGACPKCKKSKLLYFINNTQCAVPGPGGSYLQYILNEDTSVIGICPNCNFKTELIYTVEEGICTKEHAKINNYIKSENMGSRANEIGKYTE